MQRGPTAVAAVGVGGGWQGPGAASVLRLRQAPGGGRDRARGAGSRSQATPARAVARGGGPRLARRFGFVEHRTHALSRGFEPITCGDEEVGQRRTIREACLTAGGLAD